MRAAKSIGWRGTVLLVLAGATLLYACGGSSSSSANLCDSAQLKVTCHHPNGQCVEFSGLSTKDEQANASGCDTSGTPCPTAGRLGTCNIPPSGPGTGVACSPAAVINIRYFAPFAEADAQALCNGVSGAVWTPN
jgi:hypothetical protein